MTFLLFRLVTGSASLCSENQLDIFNRNYGCLRRVKLNVYQINYLSSWGKNSWKNKFFFWSKRVIVNEFWMFWINWLWNRKEDKKESFKSDWRVNFSFFSVNPFEDPHTALNGFEKKSLNSYFILFTVNKWLKTLWELNGKDVWEDGKGW